MVRIIIYTIKLIVVALTALVFTSCNLGVKGNGQKVTVDRTVTESFDRVEVGEGIELVLTPSNDTRITVETDANLVNMISTTIQNGTLRVATTGSISSTEGIKVSVSLPKLRGLTAHSAAQAHSTATFVTSDIQVKSESAASLELSVEADDISIETSSGANATVRGKALRLQTASSSGSNLDAAGLDTNDVTSSADSGSTTVVNPILTLVAEAGSGGNVRYVSTPKNKLSKQEDSGGSVYKK